MICFFFLKKLNFQKGFPNNNVYFMFDLKINLHEEIELLDRNITAGWFCKFS